MAEQFNVNEILKIEMEIENLVRRFNTILKADVNNEIDFSINS